MPKELLTKSYQYTQCNYCKLITLSETTTDNNIDCYNQSDYHDLSGFLGKLIDFLMPLYYLMVRPLPSGIGRQILDIGAGSGKFLNYAKLRGWKPVGLEVSEIAIKTGKTKYGIDLRPVKDIEQLSSRSFNCITCFHVLEHVEDTNDLLKQIERLLKKDGICLIELPVLDSLDFFLWKELSIWIGAPQHLQLFTRKNFTQYIAKFGLKVVKVKNDWFSPHLYSWSLLWFIERYFKINISTEVKKIISIIMLPLHLPIAWLAALLGLSPFKTFYLKLKDDVGRTHLTF